MYKIRIDCTKKNDLCFNNKKIKKESYESIHNKLQPYNISYIDEIYILYKNYKSFTYKSLEFKCAEINEDQFIDLIKKMKNSGFSCLNDKITIQFIECPKNIIYNYKFSSCTKTKIVHKQKTKKYKYNILSLYKK